MSDRRSPTMGGVSQQQIANWGARGRCREKTSGVGVSVCKCVHILIPQVQVCGGRDGGGGEGPWRGGGDYHWIGIGLRSGICCTHVAAPSSMPGLIVQCQHPLPPSSALALAASLHWPLSDLSPAPLGVAQSWSGASLGCATRPEVAEHLGPPPCLSCPRQLLQSCGAGEPRGHMVPLIFAWSKGGLQL